MTFDKSEEWQRQWLEAQQAQLKAYEQWFAASRRVIEAQRQSLEIAEEMVKVQMRFLTFWGL
jgi:hypothetical protein